MKSDLNLTSLGLLQMGAQQMAFIKEPPWLIQHLLTVLVFWSRVLLVPYFQLHLGASNCAPELAFCYMGSWTFAWICCPQLPHDPCKTGTLSTSFCNTRGHTSSLRGVWPPFPEIGRLFPQGPNSAWEIQTMEEKGLFPLIFSDLLKPPFL